MNRKLLYLIFPFSLITLILLAFLVIPMQTAAAQCKDPSGCRTCHEVQGVKPVKDLGAWHSQHAAYDFCVVCHGGDKLAQDKNAAHKGIVVKLDQMGTACKSCHAADLEQRYQQYASQLGVNATGGLDNIKDNNSAALGAFLGQNAANIPPNNSGSGGSDTSTTPPAASSGPNAGNIVLAAALVVLSLGGGSYVVWNERRLHGERPRIQVLTWVKAQFSREHWSPYTAGVLLGLVGIFSVWAGNHLVGASGAVSTVASTVLDKVSPTTMQTSMYYQYIMPPGLSWEVMLLVGIFFGGLFGALSSGTFKLRWNGDPTWNKIFGGKPWKRFVIGFLGAIVLQYGAGIAGGCTSGLAIAGGMLLAPSAFLFMAGMFISGIVVALIVYRGRY